MARPLGLVRGKAGIQEYTDEAVNDPPVKHVRECVTAVGDPAVTEDQARIEVELNDGRILTSSSSSRSAIWAGRSPIGNWTPNSAIRPCSRCRPPMSNR